MLGTAVTLASYVQGKGVDGPIEGVGLGGHITPHGTYSYYREKILQIDVRAGRNIYFFSHKRILLVFNFDVFCRFLKFKALTSAGDFIILSACVNMYISSPADCDLHVFRYCSLCSITAEIFIKTFVSVTNEVFCFSFQNLFQWDKRGLLITEVRVYIPTTFLMYRITSLIFYCFHIVFFLNIHRILYYG